MENPDPEALFSIEHLFPEIIQVIAKRLTGRDLAACCATSVNMREVFNVNALWKPHCDQALEEHLRKTACKIKPEFVSPETENSTLSPICQWRLAYMRENHLWNNWRQGKYKKEEIKNQFSDESKFLSNFHMFLNNNCIMAFLNDNRIELLDVREYPAAYASDPLVLPSSFTHGAKCKVENNIITFTYNSGVLVYHFDVNLNQIKLKYFFFYNETEKVVFNELEDVNKVFSSRQARTSSLIEPLLVGNMFVGILNGEPAMHIWDLNTGLKLKEEPCPLKHHKILDVKISSMNLVLRVRKGNDVSSTFLAYSLNTLSYLPFKELLEEGEYLVHRDLMGVWNKGFLNIYNYQTSELLLKNQPVQSSPKVLKNNFVFVENNMVKILNPYTQEYTVLQDVNWYEVLHNRFLQVRKTRAYTYEIWEVNRNFKSPRKTSMSFHFGACGFFLNKSATGYIVRDGLGYVMHFW